MPTKTDIINGALIWLNMDTIENPDDLERLVSRQIDAIYDPTRRELLRSASWSFATTTVSLNNDESIESPDYTYAYSLPADYINLLNVLPVTTAAPYYEYIRRGSHLHSNDNPIAIEYVRDEDDETQMDELFASAFSARIAMRIGANKADNPLLGAIASEYNRLMMQAAQISANENRKEVTIGRTFIDARN